MGERDFSARIVDWYQQNKRELPWRNTRDPYKIWLSEIILQQTRVAQGLPYYQAFVQKYPTVKHLANATEQDVLRLWQGLGYYTRARNLHKCAKQVHEKNNGMFPASYAGLLNLPGVGEYTAAAIASFAFQEPVAVVDGNVYRVLSRVFGIDIAVNSPQGKKAFRELANKLISQNRPDLHNQAVMEFGAQFCTPVNPPCDGCIFKTTCVARNQSLQRLLPVKIKSRKARKRYFYYVVVKQKNSLLMRQRTKKDIWQGLFDFPLIEKTRPTKAENIVAEIEWIPNSVKASGKISISSTYKHILTHQVIHCKFVVVNATGYIDVALKSSKFYSFSKISGLPKPVLISRFLSDNAFL